MRDDYLLSVKKAIGELCYTVSQCAYIHGYVYGSRLKVRLNHTVTTNPLVSESGPSMNILMVGTLQFSFQEQSWTEIMASK